LLNRYGEDVEKVHLPVMPAFDAFTSISSLQMAKQVLSRHRAVENASSSEGSSATDRMRLFALASPAFVSLWQYTHNGCNPSRG
jgi:hypothetical protein